MDSSSNNNRINEATIRKAAKALVKWRKLQDKEEQHQSNKDDDFMYLVVTLNKTPPRSLQSTTASASASAAAIPHRIPLPHPLHPLQLFPNICLIIGDGPKKSSAKLTIDAVEKKIKSEDIPISKVMKLSKLRSCCSTLESKRELCDLYDLFLADKRIFHLLAGILGKQFYKKKRKIPVPIELKNTSWKEEVEKACSSALLCFGSGTCNAVKVGRWGLMDSAQIVENVKAAIDGIVEVVPKKWKGVRAFHLKLSESLAMPIYQSSSSPDLSFKIQDETMKDKDDSGKLKMLRKNNSRVED